MIQNAERHPYSPQGVYWKLQLRGGGGDCGPWKPKFSKESMNQNWEIIWGGWMRVPWCQPFSHDMGGIRTSSFVSPLRSMPRENGIRDSVFIICFPTTLNLQLLFPFSHNFGWQISNCHFLFSSFVFVRYWKSEFELDFHFSFLWFCHFHVLPEPEECWHFLLLTID